MPSLRSVEGAYSAARLLITADDAGVCEEIDRGILTLSSVVTRFAVVVNYTQSGIGDLNANSGSRIGIHLNLSSGFPIALPASIPSLVDKKGRFSTCEAHEWCDSLQSALASILSIVETRYSRDDVATEIAAQLQRFRTIVRANPDFLSIHHDLDKCQVVADALLEVCPELPGRQVQLQNGLLASYSYELLQPGASVASATTRIRRLILDAIALSQRAGGIPSEVVCHPGFSTCETNFTIYGRQRETEREAWASAAIQSLFKSAVAEKGGWTFDAAWSEG